ncbi:MAG: hypothetical protein HYU25_03080 [Candidatus Rokubacteria bacterium]|nr:hypothetical protein [Candidatus Rokubacteria bacterium]
MNATKRLFAVLCGLALVFTLAAPAAAQQPSPQPGMSPGPGGQPPQMPMPGGGGMQGGGMMMCPMMSAMMGGGMMGGGMMRGGGMMGEGMMGGGGMMGMMGGQADPKTQARMLQMRGEIMKAVGDVLIKHGKALESQPAK